MAFHCTLTIISGPLFYNTVIKTKYLWILVNLLASFVETGRGGITYLLLLPSECEWWMEPCGFEGKLYHWYTQFIGWSSCLYVSIYLNILINSSCSFTSGMPCPGFRMDLCEWLVTFVQHWTILRTALESPTLFFLTTSLSSRRLHVLEFPNRSISKIL